MSALTVSLIGKPFFCSQLPFPTGGLLAISSPARMMAFLHNKVSADY